MRRHHFMQFSLRMLLISITGACVLLGSVVDSAVNQRIATSTLRRLRARVVYDWQPRLSDVGDLRERDPGKYVFKFLETWKGDGEPPGPRWLRRVTGDDCFQSITDVYLSESTTDEQLVEAIACMRKLRSLTTLSLSGAPISDKGAERVSNLIGIVSLSLARTNISDAAMQSVGKLPQIRAVYLDSTKITDETAAILSRMRGLERISVRRTCLSGAGVRTIASLPNLKALCLSGVAMSKVDLQAICNARTLRYLDVDGTGIGDWAVPFLCSMTELRDLNVSNTELSRDAVRAVRQTLPECRVISGDDLHFGFWF